MDKTQKLVSHVSTVAFVDYRPAELCIKTQWLVVFYAKNPRTQKLERFRLSVPVLKSKTERIKQGKKIVLEVNRKLDSGWLPYYENTESVEFKTFAYCSEKFIEYVHKEVDKKNKREDTLKSYKSGISMINKYLIEKNVKINFMLEINRSFVVNYLDWIYYERGCASVTYNNHTVFLGIFFTWCIERGYMKQNFALGILKKKKEPKKRQILTYSVKRNLKEMRLENKNYFALCMATYYCFIRSTELTKLKVSDVNLFGNFITISEKNSKNKKNQNVTIPNNYKKIIEEHIKDAKKDDYLFSADNFKAGKKQLVAKKIYDTWVKFRLSKKISSEFQFYSLKDTGITDLTNSGISLLKIRDQARHYDIKITETYMARNQNCDDVVKNSNFEF